MQYMPYLATLVIAGIAGHTLFKAAEWVGRGRPPELVERAVDRIRSRPLSEPLPPVLHELELARLSAELVKVRSSDVQGLATRMRAAAIAYDDALVRCCRSYGIDTASSPLTASERVAAESALLAAGADW